MPDPTGTSLAGTVASGGAEAEDPEPDSESSGLHAEVSPTTAAVPTAPAEVIIVRLFGSMQLSSARRWVSPSSLSRLPLRP
ncbi:hypothetical protein GCM10009700_08570 [Brevibacterium sanguinis]